jgi:hypothetical protein
MKEEIRRLEVKLLEKQLKLIEVRTVLFGMWWREQLDKLEAK